MYSNDFRTEVNCPVEKDISFKISTGMLFGPDDLCGSREDISDISFLSVGVKKKNLCMNKTGSLCSVLVKI